MAKQAYIYDGTQWVPVGSQATNFTNATSANTVSTPVARDSSGNFSANVITATTVNATTVAATTVNATTVAATTITGSGAVPTSGSTGQVLAKNSGTNYDVAWVSPAQGYPPLPTGTAAYFKSPFPNSTGTTGSFTQNQLYYCPVYISNTITVDRLSIACTSFTTTASIRCGIYTDLVGQPNSLVVDGGAISVTAPGNIASTVSITLNPGWYWLASVIQTTGSATVVTNQASPNYGHIRAGSTAPITTGGYYPYTYQTGITGALPATATPATQFFAQGGVAVFPRYS